MPQVNLARELQMPKAIAAVSVLKLHCSVPLWPQSLPKAAPVLPPASAPAPGCCNSGMPLGCGAAPLG